MSNAKYVSVSFASRFATLQGHRNVVSADMQNVIGNGRGGEAHHHCFTESVNTAINKLKIDTTQLFCAPQKQIMRFIQFVHAVNAKRFESVDRATAIILYSLHLCDGNNLSTEALIYIGAGVAEGKTTDANVKGLSRRSISALLNGGNADAKIGVSTMVTQQGRSSGGNGFLTIIGAVTRVGKVQAQVTLDSSNSLVLAFFKMMNEATDGQLSAIPKPKKSAE